MKYLPSKKFARILIIIVIVAICAFLAVKYVRKNSSDTSNVDYVKNYIEEKDSDNDGLRDWEEVLWKTDPNSSDTDKDGTSDGVEVKLGRNPAVAGPNDKISEQTFVNNNIATSNDSSFTQTDKFSQGFLAKYLEIKQIGGTIDESTQKQFTDYLIANLNINGIEDKYQLSDIKISQDNSSAALKNYFDKLGMIFNKYRNPAPGEEILVLKNMIVDEEIKDLAKLDASIKNYQNLESNILKLSVPSNLKNEHLDLLNEIYKLKMIVQNIKNSDIDPISSLISLSEHEKIFSNFTNTLLNINNYIMQ